MKTIDKMTFEEWLEYKRNEGQTEQINEFAMIRKALDAIKEICFDG